MTHHAELTEVTLMFPTLPPTGETRDDGPGISWEPGPAPKLLRHAAKVAQSESRKQRVKALGEWRRSLSIVTAIWAILLLMAAFGGRYGVCRWLFWSLVVSAACWVVVMVWQGKEGAE